MVDVRFPKAASGPELAPGVSNPFWPLIVTARNWGIRPLEADADGNVWLRRISDLELFNLSTLESLVTAGMGIEVFHYPLFFAVDSTQIAPDSEVPEAFTQPQQVQTPAVYEDGEEVTPAVMRRSYWNEVTGFSQPDGSSVFYVAASNGRQYQPASEVFTIGVRPADPDNIDFADNPIAIITGSQIPVESEV